MDSKRTGSSAFWRFSLRFYARPGVAPACLDLQDGAGVDVNVMLYVLFLAQQGRLIERDEVARLDAMARSWRDQVVQPLRTMRRQLKGSIGPLDPESSANLRADVKRIELAAERLQQETLERLAPCASLGTQAPSRVAAARANLAAYGAFLGGLPQQPVATLLEAFAAA